ncbi:hypothetical protein D1AOALGA4SA_1369 [Olavius algarvensis Delta 1 endosymbiont]|nr:hypothetical protein D1AOALGA4SA_1369 [Olavius algarvensis Delta 1 endosymbiont]
MLSYIVIRFVLVLVLVLEAFEPFSVLRTRGRGRRRARIEYPVLGLI